MSGLDWFLFIWWWSMATLATLCLASIASALERIADALERSSRTEGSMERKP